MEPSFSFLVDENLSPRLAQRLRQLGYCAQAVREIDGLRGASDTIILKWAQSNNAIIITCDLDFAELWYWYYAGHIGIIVLRLSSQDLKSQFSVIEYLHQGSILKRLNLNKSLVVSTGYSYRIRTHSPFP